LHIFKIAPRTAFRIPNVDFVGATLYPTEIQAVIYTRSQ